MKKFDEFIKEDADYEEYKKYFDQFKEPLKDLFYKEYGHMPSDLYLYDKVDHSRGGHPKVINLSIYFNVMNPHTEDLETTSELLKEQAFIIDNCIKFGKILNAYKIINLTNTNSDSKIKIRYKIDEENFKSNQMLKSLASIHKFNL